MAPSPPTLPTPLPTTLARSFPSIPYTYTERDVALYALAVGCGREQLGSVYENDGAFAPLPTFSCVFPYHGLLAEVPFREMVPNFNPMGVLHGEQYVEIRRPLPAAATVTTTPRVLSITDKGRAAVLVIAAETSVEGASTPAVYQEITVFARGAGGFGPTAAGRPRAPAATAPADPPPGVPPSATTTAAVPATAALLYRLTGDLNPLHADPEFAGLAGFDRPILHGLATLGYAVRAVMDAFGGGDPACVRTMKGRMSSHVFPGDELTTEMWAVPPRPGAPRGWQRIVFIVRARTGGPGAQPRTAISGGAVEIGPVVESGGDGRARL